MVSRLQVRSLHTFGVRGGTLPPGLLAIDRRLAINDGINLGGTHSPGLLNVVSVGAQVPVGLRAGCRKLAPSYLRTAICNKPLLR